MHGSGGDIPSNPFFTILMNNFQSLCTVTDPHDEVLLLVPSAASLVGVSIDLPLMEAHVLRSTHVPGNFLNLFGRGVEIRDRCVFTSFGFKEQRVCAILQEENIYDPSTPFKVICIDRPIQGNFDTSVIKNNNPLSYLYKDQDPEIQENHILNSNPNLKIQLDCAVDAFQSTYILIKGFENEIAQEIQEIAEELSQSVKAEVTLRSKESCASIIAPVIIERILYSRLHDFIWTHLVQSFSQKEDTLQKYISSIDDNYSSHLKALQSDSFMLDINLHDSISNLKHIDTFRTPHDKLKCLQTTCQLMMSCIDKHNRYSIEARNRAQGPMEVTGDVFLTGFIVCLARSNLKNILAHTEHIRIYIEHGLGQENFAKTSYCFTTLHSAAVFLYKSSTSV